VLLLYLLCRWTQDCHICSRGHTKSTSVDAEYRCSERGSVQLRVDYKKFDLLGIA
jgi:hypothetical protein